MARQPLIGATMVATSLPKATCEKCNASSLDPTFIFTPDPGNTVIRLHEAESLLEVTAPHGNRRNPWRPVGPA